MQKFSERLSLKVDLKNWFIDNESVWKCGLCKMCAFKIKFHGKIKFQCEIKWVKFLLNYEFWDLITIFFCVKFMSIWILWKPC